MPGRIRGHGRRGEFSLRRTTVGFALVALLLWGGGLMLRTAWEGAGRHPYAVVGAVLIAAGTATALLRRRRRRVTAARLAAAVTEAAEELVDDALAELDAERAATAATVPDPAPLPAPVDWGAMDPYAFEEAVAELCRRDGCADAEVVGGAGDLGADVLATAPDGRRVVVQCKRYGPDNKVGSQELQRFGGTCYAVHGADAAIVVSTGDYTAPALEYAQACGIVCVGLDDLTRWGEGAAPPPWEQPSGDPLGDPADGPAADRVAT
ncbi:restriction endonuclease [uncultured Streptomyces sp.]|uniref:restriction endonuclease n=1 Tax=uncultured Streptomyces sp. TaxID=174707 RepID=UPI0026041DF1|nr:restriction endonuclease [uncultured Streptomyces sp.]